MHLHHLATLATVAGSAAALLSAPVLSQESPDRYPSRPITFIMPFTAGGATDIENRPYAEEASKLLGKPVVLDFKPGNPARIGYAVVAKGAPDGYTIISASDSISLIAILEKNLPYDPVKDLQPVTVMTKWTTVMISSPMFPARNAKEMIAYARANPPGKLNWADSVANGSGHLEALYINSLLGITGTHIHYKGNSQSMLDMSEGRVDLTTTRMLPALPDIRAGRRKALAVLTAERSPLLPDVPTLRESDPALRNFEGNSWVGVMTTSGIPPAILKKLSDTFMKVAKSPANAKLKAEQGGAPWGSTPEEFQKMLDTQLGRWREVVNKFNIKPED